MSAPEDALIAKAAEALWDSLLGKYKRGEFAECPEQHLPWWHEQARAVIEAVREQIAAEALREAAADLAWKRPEACPCDHPDECCGSAASCDAMRPTQNVVGESWLRTRADRLDPKETP